MRSLNQRAARSKVYTRVLAFNVTTMSHVVSDTFGSNSEYKIKVQKFRSKHETNMRFLIHFLTEKKKKFPTDQQKKSSNQTAHKFQGLAVNTFTAFKRHILPR